jgi:aminoglycoside/choline kinase family phosphotransferase
MLPASHGEPAATDTLALMTHDSPHTLPADARLAALTDWLQAQFPGRPLDIRPASADASFRRYFRVTLDDGSTHIAMDAPPPQEDCRPFLAVQRLFESAGAHVPAVRAEDVERGFLLLSDLGSTTYLDVLDAENAPALYCDATTALIAIQKASQPGLLPEYDRDRLLAEMELFPGVVRRPSPEGGTERRRRSMRCTRCSTASST